MKKYSLQLNEKELIIEIKNLAEQADGSALIRYGDTLLLATCVMEKEEKQGLGFFPLTVDYEERYYAAGKIRGARYTRREGRPADEAILVSRLIDRSIRPRFPEELKKGIQVILTCLAWDAENDPDIIGLIGASISLSMSNIPWIGPISAVRVGRIKNKMILNPTYEERGESDLDLILAGGTDSKDEVLINMAEGNFQEVSEESVLEAVEFAKPYLKKICDFQKKIAKEIGQEKILIKKEEDLDIEKETKEILGERLEKALFLKEKRERNEEVEKIKKELLEKIKKDYPEKENYIIDFFEKETKRLIQENIIKKEKRVDGRKLDEIRKIDIEAGLLPRTHGSGFFSRGQTKSLSILTLGAPGDQQLLEGMEIVGKKRFMHHYNFPPYSVGEVRPLRGPGRRDIGHGILVEKALFSLIPSFEEFPYTIRIVSEILSSNGSSSMASISSSSLALMDAGVPIKKPAAGIAIGLVKGNSSKDNFKILLDIQGPEDHYGDMDFKVAGTKEGITVIQMDVKINGINSEIFKQALFLGKKARFQILEEIRKILPSHRPNLSIYAPKILTLQISVDKIREVIGPGGKIINEIIAETGAIIDIQQTGLIFITSDTEEGAEKALNWIKNLTREVQMGEIFEGKVKRILEFGAFVEVLPGQEGLIHISKLSSEKRIDRVEDVVNVGDTVIVKVIELDKQGRINLALQEKK